MITTLEKKTVYQWLNPPTASGLRFHVITILASSYVIRYLNYKYFPVPNIIEISKNFIYFNALDILRVGPLPYLNN